MDYVPVGEPRGARPMHLARLMCGPGAQAGTGATPRHAREVAGCPARLTSSRRCSLWLVFLVIGGNEMSGSWCLRREAVVGAGHGKLSREVCERKEGPQGTHRDLPT